MSTASSPSPLPAPETSRGRMRAIVQPAYGPAQVLRLEEVERPTAGAGEVLLRVRATSVCRGDTFLVAGRPYPVRLMFGLRRPKHRVPGQNVAGEVEAVGPGVASLRPGDAVYGELPHGAFAEYVAAPARLLAPKPANLSFAAAAAAPVSGATALQGLRDVGRVQPGQRVLIHGASGGVGTFAVQIARALGARVTAVCSTRHVELLRSLGADEVVDYTREDFTGRGPCHDVMLDLVGDRSLADCRAALTPRGVYIASAGAPGGDWLGPLLFLLKVKLVGAVASQTMTPLLQTPRREDLLALNALFEAGKLRPVIEQRYPLAQAAAAIEHVSRGHAQGVTVLEP